MATISNIYLDQGADYSSTITLTGSNNTPLDLSDYEVDSQMRKSYSSSQYYTFTCIVIDALEGKIRLQMPAATSENIKPGRWLYDIEITHPSAGRKRVVEGVVIVTPQITRVVVDEGDEVYPS